MNQKTEACLDTWKCVNNITKDNQTMGYWFQLEKVSAYIHVPFGSADASSETTLYSPADRWFLTACLLATISPPWLWGWRGGVSSGSETEVPTPSAWIDELFTCEPKSKTASSGVPLTPASPFESEGGKWQVGWEYFATGARGCDGPLDKPPDELLKSQLRFWTAAAGLRCTCSVCKAYL